MKLELLAERINDYKISIKAVVDKKIVWSSKTKKLITKTLNDIVKLYDIGWQVQELNWISNKEAVNITFNSFPPELIQKNPQINLYQFIQGAALVFSQAFNGDIYVFILLPIIENMPEETSTIDLGVYPPENITEKLIFERVDDFLKRMIDWELPTIKSKLGY